MPLVYGRRASQVLRSRHNGDKSAARPRADMGLRSNRVPRVLTRAKYPRNGALTAPSDALSGHPGRRVAVRATSAQHKAAGVVSRRRTGERPGERKPGALVVIV